MNLYYYHSKLGNFGDDLNGWLWPKIFGDSFSQPKSSDTFVGFGTILDERLTMDASRIIIFGTGVRGNTPLPKIDHRWDIRFVRGPISAKRLSAFGAKWLTDSATCIRFVDVDKVKKRHRCSFIPHFRTAKRYQWTYACELADINLIDPRDSVDHVLREIQQSSCIITEALHGAIIADAFRIPWVRVTAHSTLAERPEVAETKWADWGRSMEVEVRPSKLPTLSLLNAPMARLFQSWRKLDPPYEEYAEALCAIRDVQPFALSDTNHLDRTLDTLWCEIEAVRRDYF